MRGRGSGTRDAMWLCRNSRGMEEKGQGKQSAEGEAVGGEQGSGRLRGSVWRSLVLCAPSGGT